MKWKRLSSFLLNKIGLQTQIDGESPTRLDEYVFSLQRVFSVKLGVFSASSFANTKLMTQFAKTTMELQYSQIMAIFGPKTPWITCMTN